MSKVIFARGSLNRKPEFQLITRLYKQGKSLKVNKMVAHPKARGHLASFEKKYELLTKYLSCRVAKIEKKTEDEIWFEFIKGESLQTQFETAISRNDFLEAVSIIEKIFNVIDSLPTNLTNPVSNLAYKKIFGGKYNKPVECVKLACIDSNLDNFIEGPEGLTLIDYEWVYDFPVPKSFLKMRVLHSAFAELNDSLLKAKPNHQFVSYNKLFYIPKEISDCFAEIFNDLPNYYVTNASFLNYIEVVPNKASVTIGKRLAKGSVFLDEIMTPLRKLDDSLNKQRLDEEHIAKQEKIIREQIKLIQDQQERISQFEHTISHRVLGRTEINLRRAVRYNKKR